jgi:hypothetical protein
MTARPLLPALCALALTLSASPGRASDQTWTAIISRGFPDTVFTWHLNSDGRYREDGRNAATGASLQPTLSGHWTLSAHHMVLRQDGINYVFDGVVTGAAYQGVLYLDGKPVARFCALKGSTPPKDCYISA